VKKIPWRNKWSIVIFLTILIAVGIIYQQTTRNDNYLSPASLQEESNTISDNSVEKTTRHQPTRLVIEKISIDVPVIPNVNGADKTAYFSALQNGVAQLKGSADPGQNSNIFIFGHSSYYAWDPGKYKEIFAHLDLLKEGDVVRLYSRDNEFNYLVQEQKLVEPNDISVAKSTDSEQLTLMTCWPPGTTDKRLVIVAVPVL